MKSGEGGVRTLAPLLTTYSLSRRAPSASWVLLQININIIACPSCLYGKRRRWDSNPRSLSESLVFKTSSLNHSDTSPKLELCLIRCAFFTDLSDFYIIPSSFLNVNNFFIFFYFFLMSFFIEMFYIILLLNSLKIVPPK